MSTYDYSSTYSGIDAGVGAAGAIVGGMLIFIVIIALIGIYYTNTIFGYFVILLVTILVIAKVAIKIYSNAILNYGTKMGIKDIINLYKEKEN